MNILEVKGLEVHYGETQVLWGVDFTVGEGEFVSLIGANGAGKTTLLKAVVGLLSPRSGTIRFAGKDITGARVEERIRSGMAMVPEGRRLFKGMTVHQNLRIGAYFRPDRQKVARDLKSIFEYFPELDRLQDRIAGDLSGGEQQMCALGRAFMARPDLLLVDEMSLGLAPVVVERLAKVLAQINEDVHMSIILVEQDVEVALELASRAYILDNGRITMTGNTQELLLNNHIREAYMGLI
jgi:branched-chain amino acid transport system ATP-binding protein